MSYLKRTVQKLVKNYSPYEIMKTLELSYDSLAGPGSGYPNDVRKDLIKVANICKIAADKLSRWPN